MKVHSFALKDTRHQLTLFGVLGYFWTPEGILAIACRQWHARSSWYSRYASIWKASISPIKLFVHSFEFEIQKYSTSPFTGLLFCLLNKVKGQHKKLTEILHLYNVKINSLVDEDLFF